jgi:hypothetical protein
MRRLNHRTVIGMSPARSNGGQAGLSFASGAGKTGTNLDRPRTGSPSSAIANAQLATKDR